MVGFSPSLFAFMIISHEEKNLPIEAFAHKPDPSPPSPDINDRLNDNDGAVRSRLVPQDRRLYRFSMSHTGEGALDDETDLANDFNPRL
jgi:hypothetical protein